MTYKFKPLAYNEMWTNEGYNRIVTVCKELGIEYMEDTILTDEEALIIRFKVPYLEVIPYDV